MQKESMDKQNTKARCKENAHTLLRHTTVCSWLPFLALDLDRLFGGFIIFFLSGGGLQYTSWSSWSGLLGHCLGAGLMIEVNFNFPAPMILVAYLTIHDPKSTLS